MNIREQGLTAPMPFGNLALPLTIIHRTKHPKLIDFADLDGALSDAIHHRFEVVVERESLPTVPFEEGMWLSLEQFVADSTASRFSAGELVVALLEVAEFPVYLRREG